MSITRFLMSSSALVLGLLGLVGTFAPDHVLQGLGAPVAPALVVTVQVLGALYLGFAALNWMARGVLIGGIYSRPIAIGNLMHFLVAGLAMIRAITRNSELAVLWPLALLYAALAAAFGLILFRHPVHGRFGPAGRGTDRSP